MTYPYIGKSTRNETVVLFASEGAGVQLNYENAKYSEAWLEDNFENITADYLRNTKVKIESEEHAWFIQSLAFEVGYIWGDGSSKNIELSGGYIIFNKDRMIIRHTANPSYSVYKKITLPLPPKDKAKYDQQMVGAAAIATLSNIGYTYHGGELWKPPLGEAIKESEDWPQVGDEVLYDGSSDRFESIKGEVSKVIAKYSFESSDYITIKHHNEGVFAMVVGSWVKKPPAPEEELAANIANAADSDDIHSTHVMIATAIINGEIKGLSYKPD